MEKISIGLRIYEALVSDRKKTEGSPILVAFMAITLSLCPVPLSSLDIDVRIDPDVTIPFGDHTTTFYSVGGGGSLSVSLRFWDLLNAGPVFGFFLNPLLNTGTSAQFLSVGLETSMFGFPLSRLGLGLGVSGGVYQVTYNEFIYSDLWFKGYGEVGLRISPAFTLALEGGYLYFNGTSGPFHTGITAGLSAHVTLNTSPIADNIAAVLDQAEPVFPLLYGVYKQNSIGTLRIINNESAEIRNVSVSFQAGNYTASLMACGSAAIVKKRGSIELPLYADFSKGIQSFTENGKIPGELVIRYEFLGAEREITKTLVVSVYNRNTLRWTDAAALSAFISPNSPEVLDFSKFIVGIARDRLRSGLNRNMQFGMFLFEGMKEGGIIFTEDEATPYRTYHLDPTLLDYIQYPFQTLSYKMGDLDDLGILYAAALESVGIEAALIPLANDFLVAFSLKVPPEEADTLFDNTDLLITIGDEIWIPVSFSVLREGFINSWYAAIDNLNAAVAAGEAINFIVLQDAWRSYPPSGIKGDEPPFAKPRVEVVAQAVETSLQRYIAAEFGPKIRAVRDEIAGKGGSAQLYNRLGLLYVRAGMYTEAKLAYRRAAELNSITALVNLGNIALVQKEFTVAEQWFRQALAAQPDNRAAQTGLDRALAETAK
jgi:tetratricopeptide (TPR) repeat protein